MRHHSQANAHKVYERPATLFDHIAGAGPEPEARSGYASSERSRVTMSCVLRYAAAHRPDLMVVENVVEAAKWGPDRDGSTFRWWLTELHSMGYETRPLMLNSAAFGVPQMRDRMFVACWRKGMGTPDLDHHVRAWCPSCEAIVDARQVFHHRTRAWPIGSWGKLGHQYDYRCDRCLTVADVAFTPVSTVIDWSDLGLRIGDRDRPLAPSTLDRIRRGIAAHGGRLPLVTLARTAAYGRLAWPVDEPIGTVTTHHDQALVSGIQLVAAGNTFERPGSTCRSRTLNEPTWTQHTTPAVGIATLDGVVVPFRQHTNPTPLDQPTFTQTAQQVPGLALWPTGAMFAKNNGAAHDTRYHPTSDPALTITSVDSTTLASTDQAGSVDLDNVRVRMFTVDEIRQIMAYPDGWRAVSPDPNKNPTQRDQVRLLGDGVTPPVLTWCTQQLLAIAA